jgi:ABC-type nitrate/sulfonate/bicarbonate transport system substrate-binding protein
MQKVRVGGVPEHFNLAWHLAIENGAFSKEGIDIEWKDVPGGTGAMCKALRDDELDIAIALTEGMVSDMMNGNPSKIVQFYVNSPLTWGVFVHAQSSIQGIEQTQGKKYAISRFKSGSHLMAYVHTSKHNLILHDNDFVLVGNLDGARKALALGEADVFMWEKFTTKPLVDSGEFRKIGECRTHWPSFVIAVRNEFIAKHEAALHQVLSVINLSCLLLKNNSAAPALIAKRYGIALQDAMEWFAELEYACHPEMDELQLKKILLELFRLGIITRIPELVEIGYDKNIEMLIE